MKISVLLANYNHSHFLPDNIEAILKQTHKDWEIVIVDDGSTDDSAELISSYTNRDKRVRPIFSKVNRGAVVAYQQALAAATGEYIYGSAADDYICSDTYFEKAIEKLRRYPMAAGVFGRSEVVDADTGKPLWIMGIAPTSGFIAPKSFADGFFSGRVFVPGCAAIWKRNLVNHVGGFDPSLGPQTDYFINHALPMMGGVVFHNETVSVTRYQPISYSASADDASFFHRHALVERKFLSLDLSYKIQAQWLGQWRDNIINGRLAVARQTRFITEVRSQLKDIQPWEVNSLPKRFVDCQSRLLEECAELEKELVGRVEKARHIFANTAGALTSETSASYIAALINAPRAWNLVRGIARRLRRAARELLRADPSL